MQWEKLIRQGTLAPHLPPHTHTYNVAGLCSRRLNAWIHQLIQLATAWGLEAGERTRPRSRWVAGFAWGDVDGWQSTLSDSSLGWKCRHGFDKRFTLTMFHVEQAHAFLRVYRLGAREQNFI